MLTIRNGLLKQCKVLDINSLQLTNLNKLINEKPIHYYSQC